MGLVDRIEWINAGIALRPVQLPDVPVISHVATAVAAKFETGNLPDSADLGALRQRLRASWRSGGLGQVSGKQWHFSPWCLWGGSDGLASELDFLRAYISEILRRPSRMLVKNLIGAYLRNFEDGLPGLQSVGEALSHISGRWSWPWPERHQRFSIFDPARASIVLARICLAHADPRLALEDCGITGPCRWVGLDRGVYLAALAEFSQVPAMYNDVSTLERLLNWATAENKLAYDTASSHIANALLRPWTTSQPADEVRRRIEEFLLKHLGDPRIADHKWHGIQEDTLKVMYRWLVDASLEQFLSVVDQVETDPRWRYRRQFWTAYHRRGHIQEAWVVLSRDAAKIARRGFGAAAGFGRFSGNSASNEAALLMRIGNMVICEWSDSGSCRIWTDNEKASPGLYTRVYSVDALRADADVVQPHFGKEQGHWQAKVEEYIRRRTSIRIYSNDYMPH